MSSTADTHCRGTAACEPLGWLLEDVFDRHPVGCDFVFAGLLSIGIARLVSTFPGGERGDKSLLTHPLSLTAIAFVVTAIPSFLLTKLIGKNLESLSVMGWRCWSRRGGDVDCGCDEGSMGKSWTRREWKSD